MTNVLTLDAIKSFAVQLRFPIQHNFYLNICFIVEHKLKLIHLKMANTMKQSPYNPERQYSEDFSLESLPSTPSISEIVLRIIAKTRMNNGHCYLGLNEETGRIYRPITRTQPETCCWPSTRNFSLLKSYRFRVTFNPDHPIEDFFTPLPHRYEDMVVASFVTEEDTGQFDSLCLLNKAERDVNEIFPGIQEKRYLNENADSRSTGILKCRSENVSIYFNDWDKRRCSIQMDSGSYEFPVTGIDMENIPDESKDLFVVLGLARPYNKDSEYVPARCYILVVGLFIL